MATLDRLAGRLRACHQQNLGRKCWRRVQEHLFAPGQHGKPARDQVAANGKRPLQRHLVTASDNVLAKQVTNRGVEIRLDEPVGHTDMLRESLDQLDIESVTGPSDKIGIADP